MIEFIFTIDYEIYGNGSGSLRELVYEPIRKLIPIFKKWKSKFVVFAEAVEFLKMEEYRSDRDIEAVRSQLCCLQEDGFEIGLHLHPWWAKARFENKAWHLDYSERNICELPEKRITEIVNSAIDYLRCVLGDSGFELISFRGGLWLMQPTKLMANVLSKHGIKIDSSVFKGGRIHDIGLDYRPSLRNGHCWRFTNDINQPDINGVLLEVPIYTEMVPFWKMLGKKRLVIQKKAPSVGNAGPLPNRLRDFLRLRYPRKFDFCRMQFYEMKSVIDRVIQEDKLNPQICKYIVAIGHSKDLVDIDSISRLLSYLSLNSIVVIGFENVLQKLNTCNNTL